MLDRLAARFRNRIMSSQPFGLSTLIIISTRTRVDFAFADTFAHRLLEQPQLLFSVDGRQYRGVL